MPDREMARTSPRDDLSDAIAGIGVDPSDFARRVRRLIESDAPRFRRMWSYYRNPTQPSATLGATAIDPTAAAGAFVRPYRQAQEWGLPRRITGGTSFDPVTGDLAVSSRREVVIENDIAWRIDAMVDFLVGRPIEFTSDAPDPSRRDAITALIRTIIDHNGGPAFLQQLALIGAVFGGVDVLVKLLPDDNAAADPELAPWDDSPIPAPVSPGVSSACASPGSGASDSRSQEADAIARLARRIRLEVVEPARALPLLDPLNPRVVKAYAQVVMVDRPTAPSPGALRWWRRWFTPSPTDIGRSIRVELITPARWMTFVDGRIVEHGTNTLGRTPVVHVQNIALPFEYGGAGDVEPLMPLQDELNTRLSDRAHRITMQSFRMYLGKGIEQFTEQPVAPGRMWMTDNPDAQIVEFGGDAACPSEDAHVREIREAMDKVSGVTPIAAGILKNRIGRLTSGAALRVTMLALIARTHRKRLTYGQGLSHIAELALSWLNHAGAFSTEPHERTVRVNWPDPLSLVDPNAPAVDRADKSPAIAPSSSSAS